MGKFDAVEVQGPEREKTLGGIDRCLGPEDATGNPVAVAFRPTPVHGGR